MNSHFIPFVIVWAVLAVVVLVLIVWRKSVSSHEDDNLHVLEPGDRRRREQVGVAQKLDLIDKWGKTPHVVAVVYGVILGGLYIYQSWIAQFQYWSLNDDEPGTFLPGPTARFCPAPFVALGLFLGAAGATLFRRRTPPSGLHLLPRAGAETGEERARGAALRHLSRIPREVSPPRQHSQTACASPAIRTRRATTPAACTARRARTATKARPIAPCATAARTNCWRPSRRRSAPPCRIPAACATAKWWNSTAPACTARRWRAASRRRRCAPIATASTRSSNTPTKPPR